MHYDDDIGGGDDNDDDDYGDDTKFQLWRIKFHSFFQMKMFRQLWAPVKKELFNHRQNIWS